MPARRHVFGRTVVDMTIRVQHSFQGISGIAKDQYVNTFHFNGSASDEGGLTGLATVIKAFYDALATDATFDIAHYLSGNSDAANARIKMYDLTDPMPRPPIYDEFYTPETHPGTGQNLPDEVAVCLSYGATPTAGIPIARQRGRIYIGPLNDNALSSASGDAVSRPALVMRENIVKSAVQLFNDSGLYLWVVYSPTLGTSFPVSHVWCDDAWDTQRRRGAPPTSRVTAEVAI